MGTSVCVTWRRRGADGYSCQVIHAVWTLSPGRDWGHYVKTHRASVTRWTRSSEHWASFGRGEWPNNHTAGRNRWDDRRMWEVCLRPLAKSWKLGMEGSSLKGLNHSEISLWVEGMRVAASCWPLERRYDHRSGACDGIMEPGPE